MWTADDQDRFSVVPLDGDGFLFCPEETPPLRRLKGPVEAELAGPPPGSAVLLLRSTGPQEPWMLLAGSESSVRVNGMTLPSGIRRLQDRDQIRLRGARAPLFFSGEGPARVEPFPGGESDVECPRCKLPIDPGTPAVRCPHCGVWHHQDLRHDDAEKDLPCWTYKPLCATCDRETAPEAGFSWTPLETWR